VLSGAYNDAEFFVIKMLTVLLLLAGVGHAAGQPNEPQLAWTLQSSDGGNILVTAWSSSASCVAVATDSTIDVIDVSGKRLWNWNFRQTNRFIRVTEYTSIAVSSNCDAVVLAGHVGYKYVWAADRRGMQTFFKTAGTPLATKFDMNGDTVAVVTGASVGYLFSPRLEVRWSGMLSALPIRWPSQVVDRSEMGATLFRREDVDVLFDALQGLRRVRQRVR
jgi:hypothetical protein